MIRSWVALCAQREHPLSLAIFRVLIACVILCDLVAILQLDLVVTLFSPVESGGLSDVVTRGREPWVFKVFEATSATSVMLYWLMIVACLMMLIGFCTPFSCLVLLIVWSQLALVSPSADRGIDTLLRNMLFILMFSGSGRCLSVDALIRGKGLMNEGLRCMAWPRYLIMLQVVVMYLAAGVEKMSFSWTPFGGYSALYLILQDWAVTRYTFEWLGAQPYFLFTQIGTALSLFWEWSAPLLLVAHYHRVTAGPNSKLRRFTAKVPVRTLWLIVGFGFHSMLIITMELGIFPFAMMATYVIFFDPEEWRAFFVKYGFIPPLGTSV